jgi:hypothetical protein
MTTEATPPRRKKPAHKRRANDAYTTQPELTLAIVRRLKDDLFASDPPSRVLEPSVGSGSFVQALRTVFQQSFIVGVDINPQVPGLTLCDRSVVGDFLTTEPTQLLGDSCERIADKFNLVVGNPPFAVTVPGRKYGEPIWHEHVARALGCGTTTAMLLRLSVLGGAKRRAWWYAHPYDRLYVVRPRPSFTEGGTDNAEYGVFVWRHDSAQQRHHGWIDWRTPSSHEAPVSDMDAP